MIKIVVLISVVFLFDFDLKPSQPNGVFAKPPTDGSKNPKNPYEMSETEYREHVNEKLAYLLRRAKEDAPKFLYKDAQFNSLLYLNDYIKAQKCNGKKQTVDNDALYNVYAGATTFEIEKYGITEVAIQRKRQQVGLKKYLKMITCNKYVHGMAQHVQILLELQDLKNEVVQIIGYGIFEDEFKEETIVLRMSSSSIPLWDVIDERGPPISIDNINSAWDILHAKFKPLKGGPLYAVMDRIFYILKKVHEKKVIHQNIRPNNFILDEHRLKLTGFDLAILLDDQTYTAEISDDVVISQGYMPVSFPNAPPEFVDYFASIYTGIELECGFLPWIETDKRNIQLKEELNRKILNREEHKTVTIVSHQGKQCDISNEIRTCAEVFLTSVQQNLELPCMKCRKLFRKHWSQQQLDQLIRELSPIYQPID